MSRHPQRPLRQAAAAAALLLLVSLASAAREGRLLRAGGAAAGPAAWPRVQPSPGRALRQEQAQAQQQRPGGALDGVRAISTSALIPYELLYGECGWVWGGGFRGGGG